jgi:hypothetical protein
VQSVDLEFARDINRFYGMGNDGEPSLIAGHKSYTGTIEKLFVSEVDGAAIIAAMDAGSPFSTVKFYPTGIAGKVFTLTTVYVKRYRPSADENSPVVEAVEFEAEGGLTVV